MGAVACGVARSALQQIVEGRVPKRAARARQTFATKPKLSSNAGLLERRPAQFLFSCKSSSNWRCFSEGSPERRKKSSHSLSYKAGLAFLPMRVFWRRQATSDFFGVFSASSSLSVRFSKSIQKLLFFAIPNFGFLQYPQKKYSPEAALSSASGFVVTSSRAESAAFPPASAVAASESASAATGE